MSNADFVDRMLERIVDRAEQTSTDPRWFIIALKERNEGKKWASQFMNKWVIYPKQKAVEKYTKTTRRVKRR